MGTCLPPADFLNGEKMHFSPFAEGRALQVLTDRGGQLQLHALGALTIPGWGHTQGCAAGSQEHHRAEGGASGGSPDPA